LWCRGHAATVLRVSSKVKLTSHTSTTAPTLSTNALALVTLGTGLVLVTYVTPMATIADTLTDLHGGGAARAWVMSSMSIGLAATLLATGAVGDRIGRRRTYFAGLVVTALGALGCLVATDTAVFVAARVVQGIGGAAVVSCGLAVLAAATAPGHERARATAAWGASIGVGISAGVILAGLFGSEHWRASYAVTVVLALLLAPLSHRGLTESSAQTPRRVDVPGVLLLSLGLGALVSAVTEARTGVTPLMLALTVATVALGAGFALVQLRAAEPLVEPELLRHPGFVAATIGSTVVGLGIVAMASNAAGLVQQGLGASLGQATLPLLVWSVTSVAASLLVRRFHLTTPGPRVIAISLAVVGLGELLALGVHDGSSPWRLAPAFLVTGLATGVLNAVLGRESVASVPPDRAAMGSGANNTARYLGAAIGITLFSVLMTHAGDGLPQGWNVATAVAAALTFAGAVAVAWAARISVAQ
jgi:MFS family permease